MEGIAAGHAETESGAQQAIALLRGSGLELGIVGFVQHGVDIYVQGITGGGGIGGGVVEGHLGEDAQLTEAFLHDVTDHLTVQVSFLI